MDKGVAARGSTLRSTMSYSAMDFRKKQLERSRRKMERIEAIYYEKKSRRDDRLHLNKDESSASAAATSAGGSVSRQGHGKARRARDAAMEKLMDEMDDRASGLISSIRRSSVKKGQENALVEEARELFECRKEFVTASRTEIRRLRAALARQREDHEDELKWVPFRSLACLLYLPSVLLLLSSRAEKPDSCHDQTCRNRLRVGEFVLPISSVSTPCVKPTTARSNGSRKTTCARSLPLATVG